MYLKIVEHCEECNGFCIKWNDVFDRAVDRVMDTQGLSVYDAVNQVRGDTMYKDDYSLCVSCSGTGKKK